MRKRFLSLILVAVIALSTFTDVYATENDNTISNTSTNSSANDSVRNSINMLNYLAVTTVDINASSNGRLYLEEVYSSLINNTNPEAVDDRTQRYLNELMNVIDSYRMIAVKRERLEYLYEKQKAAAIHEAVPNPLGLLSAAASMDLKKIALSFAYMAVDSVNSYSKAVDAADLEKLKAGWELDDQQAETLNDSRINAFEYMVDITQQYELSEENSLNEEEIQDFVKWKNNENVTRRLEYLVSNQETYRELGEYWLVLAKTYYDDEQYSSCLNALTQYENLDVSVLRKDYNYAQMLPLAIVSAEEAYSQTKYVTEAENYLNELLANINNDDWDLKYFAAQTYIDLYAKTQKKDYLQKAFDCVKSNVNVLIDEQLELNSVYLADIKKASYPNGATKEQKKEIDKYNDYLTNERKTEVPPVSEPLILNLDLLFALADQMNISSSQRSTIDKMLHPGGDRLFLSSTLDDLYRFNVEMTSLQNVVYEGKEITLPAEYISDVSSIRVTVKRGSEKTTFEDWTVSSINRKKIDKNAQRDMSSITATYTSATAQKYDFADGDVIILEIIPNDSATANVVKFENQKWKKGFYTSPFDNFVQVN